jgi:hypothetical protein
MMQTDVENTISAALDLPAQARAYLAEKLIESLDSESSAELPAAWREEVRRRCREIEGLVALRDAQTVFDRAYSVLG